MDADSAVGTLTTVTAGSTLTPFDLLTQTGGPMDLLPTTIVSITSVQEARADDFEQWLRTIAVPAVVTHRPHLVGHWRVLRSQEAEQATVSFTFLFDGGSPEEWDLESLLNTALGASGAQDALGQWNEMMSGEQQTWLVTPVRLDTA